MNLSQLTEKRNKVWADASALVAGTEVTAEQRSSFDAMLADVAVIDADITRVKAVEQYNTEQRSAVSNVARPNPGESADAAERVEVRDARVKESFRSYLATGRVETRDLTVAGSGVAIPQLFNPQVISAQKSYGQLYDIVTVMKTDHGNPMKLVLDNDTANGLISLTVGTAASEVDPSLSGLTLQVDNFSTGVIKVDNGLLTDAGFDLEAFIQNKFAARFFRGASSLILAGDSGAVDSLATGYATTGITSATTNLLRYSDFASAIAALEPAYQANAVWAMSNATLGYVIGLVDTNNRPLFLPDYGSATSGFVGTILGKSVKLVTQMAPVATGNVAVYLGDFAAGYTFRQQNPGIAIVRLNELYAAGYETGFVGFARCGGKVTDAGTHPIVGITVK